VSGGHDQTVRMWDTSGNAISSVRISSQINALAVARPGTIVVATRRGLLLLQFATPTDQTEIKRQESTVRRLLLRLRRVFSLGTPLHNIYKADL
jgi:hypothetical protein